MMMVPRGDSPLVSRGAAGGRTLGLPREYPSQPKAKRKCRAWWTLRQPQGDRRLAGCRPWHALGLRLKWVWWVKPQAVTMRRSTYYGRDLVQHWREGGAKVNCLPFGIHPAL